MAKGWPDSRDKGVVIPISTVLRAVTGDCDNRHPHRRKIHAEVCTMTAWVQSHGAAQVYLTECTSLVWVCSIAAFNIVTPKEFNDTPLVHYMHHSHSYRDTS